MNVSGGVVSGGGGGGGGGAAGQSRFVVTASERSGRGPAGLMPPVDDPISSAPSTTATGVSVTAAFAALPAMSSTWLAAWQAEGLPSCGATAAVRASHTPGLLRAAAAQNSCNRGCAVSDPAALHAAVAAASAAGHAVAVSARVPSQI